MKIIIFNFIAIIKKSGVVPPTLHYRGHNAKKIGPKKSFLKICTLHTVSGYLSAALSVDKGFDMGIEFEVNIEGYSHNTEGPYQGQYEVVQRLC